MLRRASRHVIAVGNQAWLEPPTTDGTALPRIEPSALMALARIGLGERRRALPLLRSMVRVARGAPGWPHRARGLAAAASALVADGPGEVSVSLDGRPVEVGVEEGVVTAVLDGIGRPGLHRVRVTSRPGTLVLAWLDLRYGLPWSVRPRREAQVELGWIGQAGARDGRSGLLLSIRNRGARILTRPVVEVELPAGAELDEETRDALEANLAEAAALDGRTLRLRLRPLAPGGYLRLPVPVRWAVGGTLIGLGASLWDDVGPEPLSVRPMQILPSTSVEIADRGAEPETPEVDASPPPRPPPPPPIRPLGPIAEVIR
jgi:hypothetical protein